MREVLWPPSTCGPGHDGERVGARPRHLFVLVGDAPAPRLLALPDTITVRNVEFAASLKGYATLPRGSPSPSLREIAAGAINLGAR